jgi:hypothetical protein
MSFQSTRYTLRVGHQSIAKDLPQRGPVQRRPAFASDDTRRERYDIVDPVARGHHIGCLMIMATWSRAHQNIWPGSPITSAMKRPRI